MRVFVLTADALLRAVFKLPRVRPLSVRQRRLARNPLRRLDRPRMAWYSTNCTVVPLWRRDTIALEVAGVSCTYTLSEICGSPVQEQQQCPLRTAHESPRDYPPSTVPLVNRKPINRFERWPDTYCFGSRVLPPRLDPPHHKVPPFIRELSTRGV
ncbi:hypothetical protein BD310DRAFT_617758 [Dichomitus squalens]|uniref:Uncharacterized protein n=1 Tax=Dichomitus squalens TaxID=114155 RepID=A0A4Q9PQ11_9APHY|nr:hypothetical protein BD310DRAFT_617758 [Dichomitus squalens]